MTFQPDPKDEPRVDNPDVYKQFHRYGRECVHCGNRHVTAAHLLGGKMREDVLEGLIPLCGSGSKGCHGAFDNGHSYIGDFGRKVTPAAVRFSVAFFLQSEAGDDQREYLKRRLGDGGYLNYIDRLEAGVNA